MTELFNAAIVIGQSYPIGTSVRGIDANFSVRNTGTVDLQFSYQPQASAPITCPAGVVTTFKVVVSLFTLTGNGGSAVVCATWPESPPDPGQESVTASLASGSTVTVNGIVDAVLPPGAGPVITQGKNYVGGSDAPFDGVWWAQFKYASGTITINTVPWGGAPAVLQPGAVYLVQYSVKQGAVYTIADGGAGAVIDGTVE